MLSQCTLFLNTNSWESFDLSVRGREDDDAGGDGASCGGDGDTNHYCLSYVIMYFFQAHEGRCGRGGDFSEPPPPSPPYRTDTFRGLHSHMSWNNPLS